MTHIPVLRDLDHRLGWQDRERAQSVRKAYERRGWQFALASSTMAVMVMSDHQTQWYFTSENGCSCPARVKCRHRYAVEECGGIDALRQALERWP